MNLSRCWIKRIIFRMAAKGFIRTLMMIDRHMIKSANPGLAWASIGVAFGLKRYASLTEVATQLEVSEKLLSRSVAKFRQMAGITSDRPLGGGPRPEKQVSDTAAPLSLKLSHLWAAVATSPPDLP
jgi:hypothetical protein